jgi:hypothetical protein
MDSLDKLPTDSKNSQSSPTTIDSFMTKRQGKEEDEENEEGEDATEETSKRPYFQIPFKTIMFIVLMFIIFANPWIDLALCKLPYCGENVYFLFGAKLVLFFLATLLVLKFVK